MDAGPAKLILVVEDDDGTRNALAALLDAAGFRVCCAVNGREALDRLQGSEPPSLILLDLSMAVMDGQRQAPALVAIPIILLSSEDDLPRIAASLDAAGYFQKPVEFGVLLASIRVLGGDALRQETVADKQADSPPVPEPASDPPATTCGP
jgi:DNA-binding response OmpR family regulator